jgi:hypothetical protein
MFKLEIKIGENVSFIIYFQGLFLLHRGFDGPRRLGEGGGPPEVLVSIVAGIQLSKKLKKFIT